DTFTYKGLMYSGVPNMVSTFGYINASWTLRSDLTAEYICRLINHMDEKDVSQCTPTLRSEDRSMQKRPYVDDFSSGYMQRVMHLFPKQGDHAPWIAPQDYRLDKKILRRSPIDDGVMVFKKAESNVDAFVGKPIAAD
ncbi:MAG: FAD-containing monooxygenase EthA, partial [Anaerolineae bacterium]